VPKFIEDRGQCIDGTCNLPASWLSAAAGSPTAGLALGAMIAGPIIERLGRKGAVSVICALAFIGMILMNAVPSFVRTSPFNTRT
jgi:MFS family permease